MIDLPRLSAIEADVLTAWQGTRVDYGFGFKVAAERCSTPSHQIRRAVRALARKGALAHCRCLWDEDEGTPKGGGYVLTRLGADILEKQEAQAMAARSGETTGSPKGNSAARAPEKDTPDA